MKTNERVVMQRESEFEPSSHALNAEYVLNCLKLAATKQSSN